MVVAARRSILGAVLTLAALSPAFAGQGGRSEITGTVVDQAKAVLPGVTITVVNEATGLERTAVTSGDGRFVIPTLVPGTYTIKAELQGFQTVIQTGVVLNVGQEVAVNLTLGVAGLAETVTVTGESPLVEVTSSKIGSNITSAEIDSLPSQGRNQLSLMQLVPGLTPSLNPGSFEGGQFNANGQATTANLFLVDGAYDNDDRRGGSQGTQARVTLDTMAEYQVLTHHYSAEYGGSSGVVVNAVTRSGANRFAGRAFYYYQDDDLNATNYFLKQAGDENPEATKQGVRRKRRRADRQEQGLLVRQRRTDGEPGSGQSQLPCRCGPAGRVVLGHDRLHRLEHVRSRRLPDDRATPSELPVGARGRADRERRDRRQQQHASTTPRSRTTAAIRCSALPATIGPGHPRDQRVQGRPRPRESPAGTADLLRRQLELHRPRRTRAVRPRIDERASQLQRREPRTTIRRT